MMTTRIVLFGTFCLAAFLPAGAQTQPATTPAPNLAVLLQAAQRAEANWQTLAQDLDARVSRLLPCDARAARAIQEVSSASATRLAALAQYMQSLGEAAAADTAAARQILASLREALAQIPLERSDVSQEQAGLETQILNLTASVRQRSALGSALEQLQQIQAMIGQRATSAGNQSAALERTNGLLADLVAAFQKREEAVRQQGSAFESERTRWNAFYAAREARGRLECTITGGGR